MAHVRADRDGEDLVRLYLHDIGQYPLLSKDDEARLAEAIEARTQAERDLAATDTTLTVARRRELKMVVQRGKDAERTFIQTNLRLVVSIAKKYYASGLPLLDLIQEGNLGLMHAVEKFDWRKGFKFSTYATWWIRQAISRGIASSARTIHLPVDVGDRVALIWRAQMQLQEQLGRPPTLLELGIEVGLAEDTVAEALRFPVEPSSLSQPQSEDGPGELADTVEDPSTATSTEVAELALLADEVHRLLVPLDLRERELLRLRFGLDGGKPQTLEEAGRQLHLSRTRIRQIEAHAISKLRHPANDMGARDLLTL